MEVVILLLNNRIFGRFHIWKVFLLCMMLAPATFTTETNKKPNEAKKVVGYVANWAKWRGVSNSLCERFAYTLGSVNSTYYSHLIYAYFYINSSTYEVFALPDDSIAFVSDQIRKAKKRQPKLKVMYALNSYYQGQYILASAVASNTTRATLISSAINMAKTYGFDGVDVNWDYPAYNPTGDPVVDKQNLNLFMQEFRAAAPRNFLLTMAVPFGYSTMFYDFPNLIPSVNWFNVEAFNLHGSWETVTGHNAPLFAPNNEISVDSIVKQYIHELLVPPEKIVLGIPMFGNLWTISSENIISGTVPPPNTPATPGNATLCYGEVGTIPYFEIVPLVNQPNALSDRSEPEYGVCSIVGTQWIGYDNLKVVKAKAEYVFNKKLAGAMVMWVDLDTPYFSFSHEMHKHLNRLKY